MDGGGRGVRSPFELPPGLRHLLPDVLRGDPHRRRWAEAESELQATARLHDPDHRGLRSGALVRLADLRIRQGRLEEAAELLAGYEHDPSAVRPLARLHLARGEVEVAGVVLRRHLAQNSDGVLQAPVLALLAEVEVAAGRLDEARAICSRLTEMAAESHHPLVRALAAYTAGVACRSAGQDDAIRHLEDALAGFFAAGLPLEAARTRLELARALEHGSPQLAAAEALAALACFEQLSAPRDADETASLLRRLGMPGRRWPRGRAALTKRELEVLALLGQGLSNDQIAARRTALGCS